MTIKNIVLVVQQKYYNLEQSSTDNFWGLGDILRGIADLHNFSLQNGLRCYADLSKHPISPFLDINPSTRPPPHLCDYNPFTVPFITDLETFLKEQNNSQTKPETIYFFSNQIIRNPEQPYYQETKRFIRNIFRPSAELRSLLREQLQVLPSPFTVIHFRVGDEDIVRQNSGNINYQKITKLYEAYSNQSINPIVLSDSKVVRKRLVEDYRVKTLDAGEIGHLGYHTNPNAIKNSLVEFFFATRAAKIFGYTAYQGYFKVSGFVRMIGAIYDVDVCAMAEATPSPTPSSF